MEKMTYPFLHFQSVFFDSRNFRKLIRIFYITKSDTFLLQALGRITSIRMNKDKITKKSKFWRITWNKSNLKRGNLRKEALENWHETVTSEKWKKSIINIFFSQCHNFIRSIIIRITKSFLELGAFLASDYKRPANFKTLFFQKSCPKDSMHFSLEMLEKAK